MHKQRLVLVSLFFYIFLATTRGYAAPYFSLGSKSYSEKDLISGVQDDLRKADAQAQEMKSKYIDGYLLDLFFASKASEKKSKEEWAAELLEVKEPSDKEVKAFYQKNKEMIPPSISFEQIKGQLVSYVKKENQDKRAAELVAKFKKDKKFELLSGGAASTKQPSTGVFKLDGKVYSEKDLSVSLLDDFYSADKLAFQKKTIAIDAQLLDMFFESKVTPQKNKEAWSRELLAVKEPSEKEIKAFYDKNKDYIPKAYEQAKSELAEYIKREQQEKKASEIIAKFKKDQKFKLLIEGPKAPLVSVNTEGFYKKGSAGAKLKLVEFADYQCPHCREMHASLSPLLKKYAKQIEYYFGDFPVNPSGISRKVAEGGYCVHKQDPEKYWLYQDKGFKEALTADSPRKLASSVKADLVQFDQCIGSAAAKSAVNKMQDEGKSERVGVKGTPTLYFNGKKYEGSTDPKDLENAIKAAL